MTISRSAGLGTILLSVLGLLLCMAGTAGVWVGSSRLETIVAALFGTADEAFGFMETKLDRVAQTFAMSRQRASGLSMLAERLKTTEVDLSTEFEPMLQTLDDVYDKLKSAEHWLDSCQAVAGGVNRVSEAIVSSDAAASREGSAGAVTAKKVAELSAGVADALTKVQVIRQELINLRDKKTLAREFAAGMITRVTELDAKLANVSAKINRFNAQVPTARASCVDLGQRVHWWTNFATVSLTLVLLWFALSQIGMMNYGWRFGRGTLV